MRCLPGGVAETARFDRLSPATPCSSGRISAGYGRHHRFLSAPRNPAPGSRAAVTAPRDTVGRRRPGALSTRPGLFIRSNRRNPVMTLLAPGDLFPPLSFDAVGGGELRLPEDLAGEFGVVL